MPMISNGDDARKKLRRIVIVSITHVVRKVICWIRNIAGTCITLVGFILWLSMYNPHENSDNEIV